LYAQDAMPRITLEEAQARALEASHRLAESRARESASQAATDVRRAARMPVVTAIAGYTRTNHVPEFVVGSVTGGPQVLYPDVPNNYRTRLDLQWPIYTGGRSDALERAARAEAAAVAAETGVARADLRLEVARSFWASVTADASVRVLEQGVTRAQAHVTDVRERLNAGLVPPNELASAEAQESRQRMFLIEARTQREVALADFNRLVGDPPQPVAPAAALEDAMVSPQDLAAAIGAARGSRQERVALERRIDAAVDQQAAVEAGRKPAISAAGGFEYIRPNPRIFPRTDRWDDSWDLGVNVSWALWDGGRVGAESAQAASLAEAARQRLAEFDSTLSVEVRQRMLEIESGRAAISAADDGVRAAREAQRVVAERFRAGVIPQIEVLDAEFALVQAELDRTRALAGVRLAEARLARAMGR
jgi:outer membrane protein TolC